MSRSLPDRMRGSVFGLVVIAAMALLPLAVLGVNVARYFEFRAAVDGDGGTRGVAVVETAFVSGSNDEVCRGDFTPDGGGPSREVDIEIRGRCEEGMRVDAFLVEPAVLHPDWWGRPTAWTPGTGTGAYLTPVVVSFLLLVLPVWAAFWVLRKPLWRSLRQSFRRQPR